MTLTHRTDGWWITDIGEGCTDWGPYAKSELPDAKHQCERYLKYRDDRRWWTSEKRSTKP